MFLLGHRFLLLWLLSSFQLGLYTQRVWIFVEWFTLPKTPPIVRFRPSSKSGEYQNLLWDALLFTTVTGHTRDCRRAPLVFGSVLCSLTREIRVCTIHVGFSCVGGVECRDETRCSFTRFPLVHYSFFYIVVKWFSGHNKHEDHGGWDCTTQDTYTTTDSFAFEIEGNRFVR